MNPNLQKMAEQYAAKHPAPNYALTNDELHLYIVNGFTAGYTAHAASVQEVTESLYKIIDYAYSHDGISDGTYDEIQEQIEKLKQFEQ